MRNVARVVAREADMEALGAQLARGFPAVRLITVSGALGAGKTTLVRGMLRGLGFGGAVKSPTFTLVEPYAFGDWALYHFDLYRVNSPEELEFIGLRDYLGGSSACVVEWPERAKAILPPPDIEIMIADNRVGRSVQFIGHTESGDTVLGGLSI